MSPTGARRGRTQAIANPVSAACECAAAACQATVDLTVEKYEILRADPLLSAVHPEHVANGSGRVRESTKRYVLIDDIAGKAVAGGRNGQGPETPNVLETYSHPAGVKIVSEAYRDGTRLISVRGEIDLSTTPELERALASTLGPAANSRRVVVDLSECGFIDSTGLGVLIATAKRLREIQEGGLLLVIADQHVLKVLKVAGLDQMFLIHRSREEALKVTIPARVCPT